MTGMSDDILRLLANLIRYGTIDAVDVDACRATVRMGDLLSKPLPWINVRAGNTSTWSPPSPGEQVLVFSPGGVTAAGVILAGIYSNANPKPADAGASNHVAQFSDGTTVIYDHAAHRLHIKLASGTVEVEAPGGITFKGDVDIAGKLHVSKAVATDDTLKAAGDITSDGDVLAGGISLKTHKHPGVMSGTTVTGAPV